MPPGERKSGMPDSVEMPAPVKITVRREARSISMSDATSSCPEGFSPMLMRGLTELCG
jgi:hypothetical protein